MAEKHRIMGGKVTIYCRENSSHWQCSTYLAGKNWRETTKEESLSHAKDFAEDWYLELKGKNRAGVLKVGKTFQHVAEKFLNEYEIITEGTRSPKYVELVGMLLKVHLLPFFSKYVVSEITPGLVQDYRIHRMTSRKHKKTGEPLRPSRSLLRQEMVVLRVFLKLHIVTDGSPTYRIFQYPIKHRAKFPTGGGFRRANISSYTKRPANGLKI